MSDHVYYIGKFKLESGRCRIYKLNILDCMTENENGITVIPEDSVIPKCRSF